MTSMSPGSPSHHSEVFGSPLYNRHTVGSVGSWTGVEGEGVHRELATPVQEEQRAELPGHDVVAEKPEKKADV